MREITTGKKISDVKERNARRKSFWTFMFGFGVMAGITLLAFMFFYVRPRFAAYVNAIRVAHKSPEAVESLRVDEIKKKGTFTISLSK